MEEGKKIFEGRDRANINMGKVPQLTFRPPKRAKSCKGRCREIVIGALNDSLGMGKWLLVSRKIRFSTWKALLVSAYRSLRGHHQSMMVEKNAWRNIKGPFSFVR